MDQAIANRRARFRALHQEHFIMPNPWDRGSTKILSHLGYKALATTSAGFAHSLGRQDGRISREEALAHAADLVSATELPISADLENGFGDRPEDAARTISGALEAGLAGCSIEDWSGSELYSTELAKERIRAAVEANEADAAPLVLTARAENHIRGNPDLKDTIARLQAFQEAGAEVLYAPGLTSPEEIRSLGAEVDRPINCLIMPGGPNSQALFEAGASRISTGSALAVAAQAGLIEAARELLDTGGHDFWLRAAGEMGTVMNAMNTPD